MPDFMFEKFTEVTPEFLSKIGVRALIIDVDNTLVTYDDAEPPEEVKLWLSALKDAGISAALVSNNTHERITVFNRSLGLHAYPNSKKPSKKPILAAMAAMGSSPEDTAILGDQLLTDVFAGKRLGLRAIVVPPIKDKKTLFFRLKRLLERPYIRRYQRKFRQNKLTNNERNGI